MSSPHEKKEEDENDKAPETPKPEADAPEEVVTTASTPTANTDDVGVAVDEMSVDGGVGGGGANSNAISSNGEAAAVVASAISADETDETITTTTTAAGAEPHETEQETEDAEGNKNANFLLKQLTVGFTYLRERRDNAAAAAASEGGPSSPSSSVVSPPPPPPPPGDRHSSTSCAIVNFIDPSSVTQKSTASLYDKLTGIFEKEFQSSLRNVPYQHARSGANLTLSRVRIHPTLQGRSTSSSSGLMNDASEWHTGQPYCHVYIATCDTVEQYRTKVRPSLQAFISQIEHQAAAAAAAAAGGGVSPPSQTPSKPSAGGSAGKSPTTSGASSGGGPGGSSHDGTTTGGDKGNAQDVIVFVPTKKKKGGDDAGVAQASGSSTGPRLGSRLGSRFAAARQRMRSGGPDKELSEGSLNTSTTDSNNVSGEIDLDTSDPATFSAALPPQVQSQLSRVERDLLRRFTVDFPNGQVCIMSSLMAEDTPDGGNKEVVEQQRSSGSSNTILLMRKSDEWTSFQTCLGSAVVAGFQDRCKRYDDELRRLQDVQRGVQRGASSSSVGSPPPPGSGGNGSETKGRSGGGRFRLGNFFLVKESLAFTYEQMCLPSEALLQYNELRALLPDLKSEGVRRYHQKHKDQEQQDKVLLEMAIAGDTTGFRLHLRVLDKNMTLDTSESLYSIAPILEHYLSSREMSLLIKMNAPVRVLTCCQSFVLTMYDFKCATRMPWLVDGGASEAAEKDGEVSQQLLADAARWAFEFCWIVKKSSDYYLAVESYDGNEDEEETPSMKVVGNDDMTVFVRTLCDILDFARLRMLQLGDLLLSGDNPVRLESTTLPSEITKPWSPWTPPPAPALINSETENDSASNSRSTSEPLNILDLALASNDDFQIRYVQLARIIVSLNRLAGRPRSASCLQTQILPIYIQRGDKTNTMKTLDSIAKVFKLDRWHVCHFIYLFRLACFQRECSSSIDYLGTLVRCFSDKLSAIAPPKALQALHSDLQAVIKDPPTEGSRFASPPIFTAMIGLRGMDPKSFPQPFRGVMKKVFSVGEMVHVRLNLSCHLPESIDVDVVSVSMVAFQSYVAKVEDSIPLKEDDTVHVLSLGAPVTVQPGTNEYELDWIPMSPGQYILSAVAIEWHGSRFIYNIDDLHQKMAVRVDVVPCGPTQSIQVEPPYLLPGHEQPVRITFSAGSDIVKEGSIDFTCSPGLLFKPPKDSPDADKWVEECNVALPPSSPNETVVFDAMVKSVDSESSGGIDHSLRAKVSASFVFNHPNMSDLNEDEISALPCVLESVVPCLSERILSVESVEVVALSKETAMVCISLLCNSPIDFTLKSWKLNLPQTYSIADTNGGDMNSSLLGSKISASESLSFGFACSIRSSSDVEASTTTPRTSLEVVLEDEHGTVFIEVLGFTLRSPSLPQVASSVDEMPTVPVKISSSASEGLINEPVDLVYTVDTADLTRLKKETILYEIDVDDPDWILSGKADGIVIESSKDTESKVRLEFVAIPIRPGTITTYPALRLSFEADDDQARNGCVPLTTKLDEPVTPVPFGLSTRSHDCRVSDRSSK